MIAIALTSQVKDVKSVNIDIGLVTDLTSVMLYVVILLDLLWLTKLHPRNHLIWVQSSDNLGQQVIFHEFLKWYENGQNSGSNAYVAHTSTFDGLTHSNSLGPWVLDLGATNHITCNKYFFLFFVYFRLFTFSYHS